MMFTKEQLQAAKQAKTPEELFQIAKQNNVELSEEKAAVYFERLNRKGTIADDELNNVSGGCELRFEPDPKYNPGEMVKVNRYPDFYYAIVMELIFNENFNEWYYKVYDTETKEIVTVPEGAMSR